MEGYDPHAYVKIPTAGWAIPTDLDHGFLDPSNYQDPDIICHVGATPGQVSLTVAPGESVGLQWTDWPVGHHGPVVNYLANCQGKCEDVDKTKLQFNKVDERGLIHPNPNFPIDKFSDGHAVGFWAADELRENGNKIWFKVPEWVAPGNYVLRHELLALHAASSVGLGIQHYPQCINLIITGSGSDNLEGGTLGTDLYRRDQPGVVVDIYSNPGEYTVPGPAVYVPANGKAAPKESSAASEKPPASPAKTSAAPKEESSLAPGKPSIGSEKTPVPPTTPSHGGYQNSTITTSVQQKANKAEPSKSFRAVFPPLPNGRSGGFLHPSSLIPGST